MKHTIIFLAILIFPSIGFGKKVLPEVCFPSVKEVRDALKEFNKYASKYQIICNAKINTYTGDLSHSLMTYYNWKHICDSSNHPSIKSLETKEKDIYDKIQHIKTNTVKGKTYTALGKQLDDLYALSLKDPKKWRDPDTKSKIKSVSTAYQNAWDDFENATKDLEYTRRQLRTIRYEEDGPCGKDSADPKVHKAYKKYKKQETTCSKLEKEYLSAFNKHVRLRSKYNEYTKQINTTSEQPTSSSGSSGSVK